MRLTSICGLGQVALAPVMSVLRMQRDDAPPPPAAGGRDGPPRGCDVPGGHDGGGGARGARPCAPQPRSCAVPPALGVVPAEDVRSAELLPARARATVDGYAVRAADTYAASETLPAFLELTGARGHGRARRDGEVGPGAAMAIPTGGLLPHGADAVVMVEHTTEPMPGTSRCTRRLAPGDGVLHAGRGGGAGRCARARRAAAAGRRPRAARGRGHHGARRARAAAGRDRLDGRRGRAAGDGGAGAGAGARRVRARARRAGARGGRGAARCAASCPTTRTRSSACWARRWPRTTSSSSPPAPRRARATSRRRSWSGWARSSATGWRCGRASRRCWPTAAACR